ncbi:MAG: OmpA family protein [Fodinibius sp.]|nr:OmpA family protein [Fodinibius sp.]
MKRKILIASIALALAGCAANDPDKRTKTGAAIGAAAGTAVGYAIDDGAGGALAGAAIGGLAGAGVGRYMDNQQREMEQALAEEQRRNELEVQRLEDQSLKIDISNEVSFDFDRAAIKPAFEPSLNKVADVLKRYPKTIVHVIGHTDQQRFRKLQPELVRTSCRMSGELLCPTGPQPGSFDGHGKGETEPRASNETESGRQLNRRVEIIVKPACLKDPSQEAYQTSATRLLSLPRYKRRLYGRLPWPSTECIIMRLKT